MSEAVKASDLRPGDKILEGRLFPADVIVDEIESGESDYWLKVTYHLVHSHLSYQRNLATETLLVVEPASSPIVLGSAVDDSQRVQILESLVRKLLEAGVEYDGTYAELVCHGGTTALSAKEDAVLREVMEIPDR